MITNQPVYELRLQDSGYLAMNTLHVLNSYADPLNVQSILHDVVNGEVMSAGFPGISMMHAFPFHIKGKYPIVGTIIDSLGNPGGIGVTAEHYLLFVPLGHRLVSVVTYGPADEDVDRYHLMLKDAMQAISSTSIGEVPFDPLTLEDNAKRLYALAKRQGIMATNGGRLPEKLTQQFSNQTISYSELDDGILEISFSFEFPDTTPLITYEDGKAAKVTTYTYFNASILTRSEYCITPDGRYTEWHQDPEHGNWPRPRVIDISRLEQLTKFNKTMPPIDLILGKPKEEVLRILAQGNIKAKHEDIIIS